MFRLKSNYYIYFINNNKIYLNINQFYFSEIIINIKFNVSMLGYIGINQSDSFPPFSSPVYYNYIWRVIASCYRIFCVLCDLIFYIFYKFSNYNFILIINKSCKEVKLRFCPKIELTFHVPYLTNYQEKYKL